MKNKAPKRLQRTPSKTKKHPRKASLGSSSNQDFGEKLLHAGNSTLQPSAKTVFYIIGDTPLVEQYAELCAHHGYHPMIAWNKPPQQNPVFQSSNIKIATTIPAHSSLALELTNIDISSKKKNLERISAALPETAPILSSSITVTATEQSTWIAGKHRLVGIAALPSIIDKPLVEVAPTIYSPMETLDVVTKFYRTIGKDIEIVQDRIGMVLPRILCQIINEAAFAIMEDIATPQDIDKVLTQGLQFPHGAFAWAEHIGLNQVYAVLQALHSDMQEERYRIAPLLKQMAHTGVWWKQAQTQ